MFFAGRLERFLLHDDEEEYDRPGLLEKDAVVSSTSERSEEVGAWGIVAIIMEDVIAVVDIFWVVMDGEKKFAVVVSLDEWINVILWYRGIVLRIHLFCCHKTNLLNVFFYY